MLTPSAELRETLWLGQARIRGEKTGGLKIGPQGSWKPVQTGLMMATTTILEIQEDLDDASDHLADFLDNKNSNCSASEVVRVEQLVDPSPPDLTKTESCVLYHLAGYIAKRVISFSLCEECQCALVEKVTNTSEKAVLLQLKEFKRGALYRPSDELFTLLQHVEQLFRSKTSDSLMESSNVVEQLEREAMSLDSNLPSCHELKKKINKILSTYVRLRLRIHSKCIGAERKANSCNKGYLGSKSQTKKAISTQQTSSPKVIPSRPLTNTLLVAMDVLGHSIPGTPSAVSTASSLLLFQQSAVATSSHGQHQPQAAAAITILRQHQPAQAVIASSSSRPLSWFSGDESTCRYEREAMHSFKMFILETGRSTDGTTGDSAGSERHGRRVIGLSGPNRGEVASGELYDFTLLEIGG